MYKTKQYLKRFAALGLALGLFCCALPVSAATTKNASNGSSASSSNNLSTNVTQSYNADPSVEIGMVVELKPKDPTTVIPLNSSDVANLLGVVIPTANATIVLTPQTITQQQVLVATTGHYDVLVSNQNGPINVGNYVTISSVAGVAMLANANQSEVIGKAAGSYTGVSDVLGTVVLKDQAGHTRSVAIGRIPIDISITHNPLFQKSADYVPGFMVKIATSVADRPVSAARIYLSITLLFITALVTGNMLYSGVRSGMIAVGRNPLSRKSIIRSLVQTVIAGLIIFVVGTFAVYLLLKL